MVNSAIQITEKPDWVSWDEIHEALMRAHAFNREHGIIMRKPSLPGDEIRQELGKDGRMFVALSDNHVVGTAAIISKKSKTWYTHAPYGYMCFASVLPEYNGKGIYKRLCDKRECIAKEMGLTGLYIDTHNKNTHVISISLKNGFKRVAVKGCKDHWNVVMFKWINGCPYSDSRCKIEFYKSKIITLLKANTISFLRKLKVHK